MENFALDISTKIHFGKDIIDEVIQQYKDIFGKKVLVIMTGNTLNKLGYLNKLRESLGKICGDDNIFIYDNVSSNPDISEISQAIRIGKTNQVTSVVGFGGGSAIDAAKAVAVGIPVDSPIVNYLTNGLIPDKRTLPIIAIPTTAGTGAELTKGAIISFRKKSLKSGIRSINIIPKLAIVDPTYTYSVPFTETMECGFDVLAHAVESYLSINANYFSDMLSEKAIKNTGHHLRKLSKNIESYESRDIMSFSSMIMGFNVNNIGNCLPHRMQYPVGAVTETSHGAGLLALYPSWFGYEYEVNTERVNNVLSWLGKKKAVSRREASDSMLSFILELGIPRSLSGLGIKNRTPEELASMVTGNIKNDKLSMKEDIIATIYEESI